MLSRTKQLAKSSILKIFYTYKRLFLKAPVPPARPSTFTWGSAPYPSLSPIPKIVWIYWHDDNLTPLSKLCIEKIRLLNPDYTIHLTTNKTLHHFVPDLIPHNQFSKDLPLANYSDLVRLSLLEKFGGFYLDASVILNVPLAYFSTLLTEANAELVLFNLASITDKTARYPMTESWFLGAVPDAPFIKDWKAEFVRCVTSTSPKQYYPEQKEYLNYVQRIPVSMRDYLLVYLSSQAVMQRSSHYKLLFLRAEESGFLYLINLFWNYRLTNDILTKIKQPKQLPILIKLASEGRTFANEAVINKTYQPSSIIGHLAALGNEQ